MWYSQNMKDQNKMEIEKNFRFRNLLLLAILGQMEINLRGLVSCKLDLVLAINCISSMGSHTYSTGFTDKKDKISYSNIKNLVGDTLEKWKCDLVHQNA